MTRGMTDLMRHNLGYDENGNNTSLMSPGDFEAFKLGYWRRADQNTVCVCGSTFREHPQVQGALWLIRTCTDGLVKL
jgi:hypothetical protein